MERTRSRSSRTGPSSPGGPLLIFVRTAAQTLSGAEADSITNYADLFLRFVGNQV